VRVRFGFYEYKVSVTFEFCSLSLIPSSSSVRFGSFKKKPLGSFGSGSLRFPSQCYGRISIGSRRFEGGGLIWPKISRRRGVPSKHLCTVRPMNAVLSILPLTVFAYINFVADFLLEKFTFRKTVTLRFKPLLWGFGATYPVNLRHTGKPVVDFLFVILNFFAVLRLRRYERIYIGNRRF